MLSIGVSVVGKNKGVNDRREGFMHLGSPLAVGVNREVMLSLNYSKFKSTEDVYFEVGCVLLQHEWEAPWILSWVDHLSEDHIVGYGLPLWVPRWDEVRTLVIWRLLGTGITLANEVKSSNPGSITTNCSHPMVWIRPAFTLGPDDRESLPRISPNTPNIGFDNDDIETLVASIASSHAKSQSFPHSLPRLLPELLLHILLEVPPTHILPFRLLSRVFRDLVDAHIFYSYLTPLKLVSGKGVVTVALQFLYDYRGSPCWKAWATFDAILRDESIQNSQRGPAIWSGAYAQFRVKNMWLLSQFPQSKVLSYVSMEALTILRLRKMWLGPWTIYLDEIVNDTAIPGLTYDPETNIISFK
ncbi:hypothetical protein GQ43DRAFT_475308 [Delitschia confertaspora ATCC 74209]|uniref:F-box domain-containing protein n=1 Tax=Delitschia confertaspora ATCC 74209 TaxID=1513339 RepID=A0A9P4JDS7_9PLEO|nr:hypothetical protein GQ43DRAFT_475308 [Delitschia confertaspora ATCC 74209]